MTTPDRTRIRARFPAIAGSVVFLENAGGSQVPDTVADGIRRYMTESYVQLGAGYELSRRATAVVDDAHAFARIFVNAGDGTCILGPSSTALLNMLAEAIGPTLAPGARIVLAETGHEANLGCWKRLERLGVEIVWWRMDPRTFTCPLDTLDTLLDERVALVALPHVSNLLGGIVDLGGVVERAHAAGARVVADGVAYAPHRAIDVQAWDVDFYVFSTYKVYGPHMAVLYGKADALAGLTGPNHFFVPNDDLPYKFEPGGANHESCAGWLGVAEYLSFLAGRAGEPCDRAAVETAGARMAELEAPLVKRLLAWLDSRDDVQVIGPTAAGPDRVGTISFVHASKSSREISEAVDRSEVAIRYGHMYAWHLCDALGLAEDDGVVRVSCVHYNTVEEIERLIAVLEDVL